MSPIEGAAAVAALDARLEAARYDHAEHFVDVAGG
jgi:hypothetical protein